jgi:Zn-dependent protease
MIFSVVELKDLAKAWLLSSLAYALALVGFSANLMVALPLALVTAGAGIILHELAHKFTARHYGYHAEFRSFDTMLFLSVIISAFGVVFLAPGAVYFFSHQADYRKTGVISLAGPLTNIIIAILSVPLAVSGLPVVAQVGMVCFQLNAWLALFNLIPFAGFDGQKVLAWNRYAWAGAGLCALALVFAANFFF